MKKKILLIISMFLFMTNVKALTFNVNLTNIEDKGNDTIGSIEKIDIPNRELDVLFQDIGDEVNFGLTITNSGDRAGTLREIEITSQNNKIEYTTSLPEEGLAINGNDSHEIIVKAKVLEGAVNGTSTSTITITYKYDEGSCPEGEILSADESMCLCPDGKERNENGICVVPEKEIVCEEDEIYNESKKICEKKVVPITPSNPKTLDNIILITLLFVVSGLGIYAVMFKKLNTNKKKVTAGVITGVITLGASFTVLAGVFGLDNLLSAIVNPITKSKTVVVTVNEEIDLIETWDGNCDITELSDLTPSNIFDGGSGTEEDPYQVRTAEQLSCFAKSVNNGTTYEGKFIKQTKNIKLNDKLLEQVADQNNDLSGPHIWYSAGSTTVDYYSLPSEEEKYFAGTYDGDNKVISGLYITDDSAIQYGCKGLFGYAKGATLKNIKLTDVYAETSGKTAALLGYANTSLTIDNVVTSGIITNIGNSQFMSGILSIYNGNYSGNLLITNTTNNVNITTGSSWVSGIVAKVVKSPNTTIKNSVNKGTIKKVNGGTYTSAILAENDSGNTLIENCGNNGSIISVNNGGSYYGTIVGYSRTNPSNYSETSFVVRNCYNTGSISGAAYMSESGGLLGNINGGTIENCYNSGNITTQATFDEEDPSSTPGDGASYFGGILGLNQGTLSISNCYNTGMINITGSYTAGIVGGYGGEIDHCYNTGTIYCGPFCGGILSYSGNVRNSYNKGKIVQYLGPRAGGIVGYQGNLIENSYNEGEIVLYDGRTYAGGLCSSCELVRNSYNRGNITAKGGTVELGGISYLGIVENSYNSGKLKFIDVTQTGVQYLGAYIGGIASSGSSALNTYNLGDIEVDNNGNYHNLNASSEISYNITGISPYTNEVNNSVNMGNITFTINSEYTTKHAIAVLGITRNVSKNSYNGGTLTIDDSELDTSVREQIIDDGYGSPTHHKINVSEITLATYNDGSGRASINNHFANPDGLALACYPTYQYTPCTLEDCLSAGTYTSDPAPNILDIINADSSDEDDSPDNAFEILEGDTLPTLKVFNQ